MAKPKVGQIAASKPRFEEVNGDGHVFQGVNFYDDTPVPVAEPAPAVRTWGEAATDMGAGALKGALGVAQLGARVGDALTYRQGDENPAIRFLNEYGEAVDMQKSAKLRDEEQKAQQAIAAAGQSAKERYGDGLGGKVARFGAEFGTGAYEAVSNPTLLANSLAEQIPMMGTMKAGQKAAELLALGATKVAPGVMATSIGKRIAGNAGLGGAVATGMALQGSDIKGDTYRRMMELPLDMWRQNPEFVTLAKSIGEDAAKIEIAKRESSTAGWQSAGASLATSLLPGGTAMERALVGGKKIPLKAVPQSVAGEFTQESGEEGLGQLASNNAVAKINAKQDRMEGVGGAAGQGGAVGGVLGGSTTLARVGLQNYADKPTTPAIDPAIAAAAAQAAQQEAARKAAVSAAHTAAATPNSPISRMVAAANPLTPEEAWAKAQELDAQAALDEANGVAPVDPDTAPAAVPSGDPIEDTQKLIDASLAQAEQDKAAQRAATDQPADPLPQAGEAPAPTVKDSLTAQTAFDVQAAQEQYRADTLAAQKAQQAEIDAQAEAALAKIAQRKQQTRPTNEVVSDGGYLHEGTQDGDVLNGMGKPFTVKMAALQEAKRRARESGGDWTVAPVFDGFVARKKAANQSAEPVEPAQEATENVANDQYQTDDERLASKRAAWQALKSTGAPDDVVASSVQGYQQKANAIGKPMVLWRHPTSGTLGFVPQGQKTPFAGGEVVATIHPDAPESVIAAQVSAQSKSNPLAGQPIDKDWTAFHPESGTLNVPRADMPQIKAEHRGAMVNFLKARGIDSTQEEVPTESLKPTQAEYSPEKVEKAKGFTGNNRSILVSSDGHVLDGHHQWVAKHEAGEPVKVIRLDAPIDALLSAVREFPSAETTVNSTTQDQSNEEAPKTEQDSAKPEAAGAEPVNAAEPDQPAAERGVPAAAQAGVVPAAKREFHTGELLPASDLLPYYEQEIRGVAKGVVVPNPLFELGAISEATAKEVAIYIDGYTGEQRRLRVSGRTLKHIEESRPSIAREIVEQLPGMFTNPDEVLPDHKHPHKRALLVKIGEQTPGESKPKSHVATVEVEIEVEVSDGFIDIVTIMTAPDRSLKAARDLKDNWPEGQQRTEQAVNSPHPLTAEAANPAADSPDTRPVADSLPQATESSKRPKNWDKNYGSASKIAQAMGISLRGANRKMKKVPELVADIKAADAAASAAAQDADLSKSQPKVDTTAEPVQKDAGSEQVEPSDSTAGTSQQKALAQEIEDAQNAADSLPSQEASNTIQSSQIEDAPIAQEDRDVLDAAKAKIAELDSKIERHEALLNCLK